MLSNHPEYILAVAETRSFSKAADELFITQPSLSRFIILWEQKMGLKLFDRKKTPLELTPQGEVVVQELKNIVEIEKRLLRRLEILQREKQVVTFGATPTRVRGMVFALVKFNEAHPDIHLQLYEYYTNELKKLLQNGDLDFYIGAGPSEDQNLCFEELMSEQLYLAISPQYCKEENVSASAVSATQIKTGNPLKLPAADLQGFRSVPVIGYHGDMRLQKALVQAYDRQEITPNIITLSHSGEIALKMVHAGLGITLSTSSAIKNDPQADELRFFSLGIPDWPIGVYTRQLSPLHAAARTFVQFIRSALQYRA